MVTIGLFDSGFGGLTVVRELNKQLPGAGVEFYGDNGRAPYGPLSREQITGYVRQILDFLSNKNIDAAIMACNTATAAAFDRVKDKYSFPLLGVIEPGIKGALAATRTKKIGVVATQFTIKSGAHKLGIQSLDPAVEVIGQACPQITQLVESGLTAGPEVDKAVSGYLGKFEGSGIDTLVLGCTHYPVLLDPIKRYLADGVTIVDPAVGTVAELKELIGSKVANAGSVIPTYNFYTSGDPHLFARVGSAILGWPIERVQKVVL